MDPRLASQSFLGPESDTILAAIAREPAATKE